MTEGKSSTTPAVMTASGNASGTQVSLKKMASHQGNKTQKPRTKPAHPRTADMVNIAIKTLKERGGSSLQAIKKYISATYKIDADKQAPFIKKYLKAAVTNGNLIQTKGKGAAGSFKLSVGKNETSKIKKKPTVKSTGASPLKKASAITKKPVAKKPIVKKVAVKKSSSKVTAAEKRKTIKGPAAKPPKVKSAAKVKATPKSTAKKTPAVKKSTPKAKAKRPTVAKKVAMKKK
ncbi:hypothetical protein PV327_002162 [Microctonus hyperodae]|uniref:H15 domain-containing protein n=1 Tax=Microctonus hyperodae TaxID=165561 RepID=A0AA39FFE5_MICHY|nr:hypothetical protein PV327_002162 [Microctonus hyperodae]